MTSITESPAVEAAGLVYLAGTRAQNASGEIVSGGDVAAQTRHILERSSGTLAAAGASLDRVAAVTVYLKSAADFAAMNDAYRSFWAHELPTRTTVITDSLLPDALVEMSMIAAAAGAGRRVVHPAGWMTSPNPYSYAIQTGETLFLSGLVARNGRDNSVVRGDVATQTRVILDNARDLLEAAGMTHADVVSARVFLTETTAFHEMNTAYRPYFPTAPPARATVQAGLAGSEYAVEMTLIASSAPREAVNTGDVNPNLSGAVRAGNRLYMSGVLGNTPENAGDAAAQTRETFARIRRMLDAAGFAPDDIVDGVVYLTDLAQYGPVNEVYRSFFQRALPARVTVRSGLVAPGAVVEIMFTAVKR